MCPIHSLGKVSAGQVVVDTDETKVVNSPAKTEKGDIPLTIIDCKFTASLYFVVGKGSVRQLALNLEVEPEKTKLVNSPAKTKKSDVPLNMIGSKLHCVYM